MRVLLAASLYVLAIAGEGWAHGPAPAPLEMLPASASEGTFTPSLIRLNIGLARLVEGAWVYGCPSQYGDAETARMAATDDSELVVAVGGGEAYASDDQGCSFELLGRDEASDFYALRASGDGDGVWVLAGNAADGEGALTRLDSAGAVETTRLFVGSEGLIPDSLIPWSAGDRSGVLVAGAAPSPRLWRGERHVHDGGVQWTWTSWPLQGLDASTAFLRLAGLEPSGGLWLVVTDQAGRNLWRGSFAPDAAPSLTSVHSPVSVLRGPVRLGERYLAVFDGQLKAGPISDDGAIWAPLGETNWTCLDEVRGDVLACSLTRLERLLDDGEEGAPPTETVFMLAELQGPRTECMTEEAQTGCFSDWVHFGVEAGLYTPGDPLLPPSVETATEGGCVNGSSLPADWMMVLALTALAWSRRRRAC